MKSKKARVKLAIWALLNKGQIILTEFDKQRIRWFCQDKTMPLRIELSTEQGAKTLELLGFYFAGLIPAIIGHDKFNLSQEQLDSNPMLLRDWCKSKKIKKADVDDKHRTLMFEFSPTMVFGFNEEPHKEGRNMADMGQEEALTHITAVFQWAQDNGYPLPNSVEYKKARDTVEFKIRGLEENKITEPDYPTSGGDPDDIQNAFDQV